MNRGPGAVITPEDSASCGSKAGERAALLTLPQCLLHLRPEHVALVPGFPVERVVPRIVDRLERLVDGIAEIDGVGDEIDETLAWSNCRTPLF
jgi:hypothetical protein